VFVLATGEIHVAHTPEVVYPQPPQAVSFAQAMTSTGVVNVAWGVFRSPRA
jgi:hypothetical protein